MAFLRFQTTIHSAFGPYRSSVRGAAARARRFGPARSRAAPGRERRSARSSGCSSPAPQPRTQSQAINFWQQSCQVFCRMMGLLMKMGVSRGSHLAHIALDAEPSAHLDTREHPEAAGEVGAAAVDDAARVFLARHLARVRERRYLAPARHDSFKLDPQECRGVSGCAIVGYSQQDAQQNWGSGPSDAGAPPAEAALAHVATASVDRGREVLLRRAELARDEEADEKRQEHRAVYTGVRRYVHIPCARHGHG